MRTSRSFRFTVLAILGISAIALIELERRAAVPPTVTHVNITPVKVPTLPSIPPSQIPTVGARPPLALPCATPITVTIGTIDPEFQIERTTLEAALRNATNEWNTATGREWFIVSPEGGISINLLFDGRQADLDELKEAERNLDEEIDRVTHAQEEHDRESREVQSTVTQFNQERDRYENAVATFNADVSRVQAAGSIDKDLANSFHQREKELSILRRNVEAAADTIKKLVDELNQRALSTQQDGERLAQKIAQLKERFPPRLIREAEHRKGAFVNEINVYTFSSVRDLHYALLHELGHTLGLEHSAERAAIMSPIRETGSTQYTLTPSDIAAARKICESK